MRSLVAAGLALLLTACAGGTAVGGKTTVVSLADLDCSSCGSDLARALVAVEGVRKTAFNPRSAELTVVADPSVDVFAIAQKKKPADEHWRLVSGPGQGSYLPWATAKEGSDVKEVAKDGEDVPDLAPYLAPGKITIVDFSAKWCQPCRTLDARVLEMVEARQDLAYRKLDIGDWDTPLAKRHLKGVKELPYVIVFDKSGKEVETISGLHLDKLEAALKTAESK